MRKFSFVISLMVVLGVRTFAQSLPGGVKLNPALSAQTLESHSEAQTGLAWRGMINKIEVAIKATKLTSAADAQKFGMVEYGNIYHLYDERGNPYQGQISQLIICDKRFVPKIELVDVLGTKVRSLLAGATERKVLGACNADQIANWTKYFNFIAPDQLTVLSVRLFRPVVEKSRKELALATAQLRALANKLIVRDKL